ncbi:hypothetical protein [Phenylobacterium sp.]|uniref:hypothetical protein n=1 Tax=Phenylobacterium sp. TaxID=1871053 RepID=UPI00395D1D8A
MSPSKPLVPPFSVVEHDESFEVVDADGRNIAYLYFDDRPGVTRIRPRLKKSVARRMAELIARLPELEPETRKRP